MADSSSLKKRYTLTTSIFLLLFLFTIFLFTKRALEPSLSLYRDFFPQPYLHFSSSQSTSDFTNDSSLTLQPSSPISLSQSTVPKPLSANVPVDQNELKKETFFYSNESIELPISAFSRNSTLDSSNVKITSDDDQEHLIPDVSANRRIDNSDKGEIKNSDGKKEQPVSDSGPLVDLSDDGGDKFIENGKICDLYKGTWVRDAEEHYPLYKPGYCPYVDEAFDCQINGRRDSDYLKWRWKPDGCDLPRFNAMDFLTRLKGKRLMLVGDSMNRNQFESILCMLREGLPDKERMYEIHGHKITKGRGYYIFKFLDYNCTVEFVRSHFLVKEGVRINAQGNSNPTLSIDRIDKTSGRWKRAHILVFNTGHWWAHGKTARGKNYYKEGDYLYPHFDSVEAYRRAVKTWAKWIDENINPAKQLVFYRGYSSAHFRGGDWDSGGSCNGESEPTFRGSILTDYPLKMKIVEEVISQMKVPVKLLNVTRLTNFRKDGHPSVFGKNPATGKRVSTRRQDCSHWCLPGVPDAWNELIYATLVFKQTIFGKV